MAGDRDGWFGVRCVIRDAVHGVYEERITIWQAESHEAAIERAEAEAQAYIGDDGEYVGLAQSYELADDPRDGAEVFSLMRESDLDGEAYLARFFETGAEREQGAGG